LPKTTKGFDSIWVIIDQFTKIAHFLPVKTKNPVVTYVKLYIARILSLHGIPKTIVSDRGPQFVSKFWSELHIFLGTKLLHSSTYHPQTSGQTKRVNQILEDMLRSCVMEFPQKWDDCLPLAEFSYNNNYQESIKMAPFEALHGQRCRTPLNWSEPGDRWYFRPDLVKETEAKVQQIRHHLKEAQARQKSYVDK
jgi:transposase InsO family protein